MTPHRIKRVTLALATADAPGARAWSDRCSALFPARIAPLLDRLCSEADDSPHLRRIDRLDLDLGRLDPEDDDTFLQRLADALRPALARALAERPHDPSAAPLALLTLFARTGNLPWSQSRTHDPVAAALTTLLSAAPHALQQFLRTLADDPAAIDRLARHTPPTALAALLDRTFPDHAALLAPVLRTLESTHRHAPDAPPDPSSLPLALRRAALTALTRGDVGPETFTPLLAQIALSRFNNSTNTPQSSSHARATDTLARATDTLARATDILAPPSADILAPPSADITAPTSADITAARSAETLAPPHAHVRPASHSPPLNRRNDVTSSTPAQTSAPPDVLRRADDRRSPANSPPREAAPTSDKAEVAAGAMGRRRGGPRASRAGAAANARGPTLTRHSDPTEVFAHLWRRARGTGRYRRSEGPIAPAATSAAPARGSEHSPAIDAPARGSHASAPGSPLASGSPRQPESPATRRARQHLLAAEGELQLEDGGLVLLWPFLARLFERLELIDEHRRFPHDDARHQAIALLAHLATGDPDPPEYQRALAKLLCAHDLAEPCMRDTPIPDEHQAEAEHLLRAVIDHVPALHTLDVASLRAAFLVRPAVLHTRDGTWTLQVERMPHDIVLERFPWSWMWIKLPWMPDPLRVEW